MFSRNNHVCALACWLEVSIRWVLMTAFGLSVEPEVNRNFAIVSGVTAEKALATADVSEVSMTERNEVTSLLSGSPHTIFAECNGLIAARAGANCFVLET